MMKKIHTLLSIVLLLFLSSCTKESISIHQDKESVEFSGSIVNVVVTSDLSWIIEGEYDWCTANIKTGTGNGAIVFTVKKNTTYSERTATFNIVATDGGSQVVNIHQEQNDALLVSQENVYLDAAEQSYTVEISANVDYTIEGPSKDWISVTESKSKALSKKTLTIKVGGNSGSLREASIGLKCKVDGMSTAIKVLQACEGAVIKYKTKSGKVYPDVSGSVSSSDHPTQTIYTKAKKIANIYHNGQGMILYDIALDATPRYLLMGADITEVELPQGIKAISPYSFYGCSDLIKVTIPESVTNIDGYAFDGCKSLTDITLPSKISAIEKYVFYDCESLKTISIPSGVTKIGRKAFSGSGIKSIVIPDTVVEIEDYAFSNCNSLKSVTLPNAITNIPKCCFIDCRALTEFTIPETVTVINDYAFCECTSLESVTIPKNVRELGFCAFKNCYKISKVYSYPTAPPKMKNGDRTISMPFYDAGKSVKGEKLLYVPAGSQEDYENPSSSFVTLVSNGFKVSSVL